MYSLYIGRGMGVQNVLNARFAPSSIPGSLPPPPACHPLMALAPTPTPPPKKGAGERDGLQTK